MDDNVEIFALDSRSPRFPDAQAIRRQVFVEEQGCPPEEEWDDWDAVATHLVASVGGVPAGTLRSFDDAGWLHIGRLAVLPGFRGRGLAGLLMRRCLEDGKRAGFARSFLNSQWDKTSFYRNLGYREVGGEFVEAGIRHVRMELFFEKAEKTG